MLGSGPVGKQSDWLRSSAWERPGFLLWHATLHWQRLVAEALRPLGLTHAQFVLLAGVVWLEAQGGGPPSQRELADHAGTDAMMTSQIVRALEGMGFLSREGDPNDARVKRLRITSEGRAIARKGITVVEAVDAELFDAGDRDRTITILRRLARRDEHGEPLA